MSIQDKPGFKKATEILSKLSIEERKRIIEDIAKADPSMAEELKKNIYQFEDLKYLTPLMLVEFLREINIDVLALALRGSSQEVRDHILKNVSSGIKNQINDTLMGRPRPAEQVVDAMDKIMEFVQRKIEKGELVLSKDSSDKIID